MAGQSDDNAPRKRSRYRPDIDGLRALAVSAVVVNHAFPDAFQSGFVGVDIFYVISGYLITGILLNSLGQGHLELARFYSRRVLRIVPALVTVLLVTSVVAALLYPPMRLAQYGESLLATGLFASNFYFWQSVGYFAPEAHTVPLLHTWSLAIEEQFYIFFPLILWLAWKLRLTKIALVAGFVISLALSIVFTADHPTTAFYLLPTRAWELLLGAIIAAGILPALKQRVLAEGAAILGVILLVAGFAVIDKASVFPGWLAVLPVLGTGLVIYSGTARSSAAVGTIFAFKPVIFVGWISYSLYLWHWPVLAFLRYQLGELDSATAMLAIALSVVLASASWWFVERRFHRTPVKIGADHKPVEMGHGGIIARGLGVLAIVSVTGFGMMQFRSPDVVRTVYSEDIAALSEATIPIRTPDTCHMVAAASQREECRIGDPDKPASLALWGDSYLDTLVPSLPAMLEDRSAYGFVLHSCPPILGTVRVDDRRAYRNFGEQCTRHNREVIDFLEQSDEVDTVVLFGLMTTAYDLPGEPVWLIPEGFDPETDEDRLGKITDRIVETVERLRNAGKTVIVVGAYYSAREVWATEMLKVRMRYGEPEGTMPLSEYDRYSRSINDRLRELEGEGVILIDPRDIFCDEQSAECNFVRDGKPWLTHGGHLTTDGAERLNALIAQALVRADANAPDAGEATQ